MYQQGVIWCADKWCLGRSDEAVFGRCRAISLLRTSKNAGFACFFAVSRETLGILCDVRRCVAEQPFFRPKSFFTQSVHRNCLRKLFAQIVRSTYRRATFRQVSCLVSPAGCFVKYASKMRLRHIHASVFMINLHKILKKIIC